MLGPTVPPHGPSNAKILLLAEAPGEKESELLKPLVGPPGHELRRMLRTIGVDLDACYKTNVFSRRPPGNDIAQGYGVPREDPSALLELGPLTNSPTTFLSRTHVDEVLRVQSEIAAVNPNIIIALGNTATWALGLGLGISTLRGSVHSVTVGGQKRKVLPTYHPAAVLRQWDLRVIALADLEKARVESLSPELAFDNTELWLDPSLEDLATFHHSHMAEALSCATDVETKRGQITCVSFSPAPEVSLCIPFWSEGPDPNFWPDVQSEREAWRWVFRWIEDPALTKVMQNGLYDLQYFIRHGMKPRACTEDTMLAHHSLYSELQKGLGFLGSIYANTPSWKQMRTFKKEELLKKDD